MMPKLHALLALSLLSLAAACGGDSDSPASGSPASGGSTAAGGSTSAGAGGSTSAGAGGSTSAGAGGSTSAGAGGSTSAGAGGSTSAGAGGSTSAGAGGSTSAGAGGASSGACNQLVNDGAPVPEVAETGTPPAMTGGAVADGTYVLTGRKDWMGSCGCNTRQKLQITGDVVQVVSRTDADPEVAFTGKATYAGSNLTLAMSCPASKTLALTYTATATTLMIFDPQDQSLEIYTKQ